MSDSTKGITFATLCWEAMNEKNPPWIASRLSEAGKLHSATLSGILKDKYDDQGRLRGVKREVAVRCARGLGKPDDYFDDCINVIGGNHRTNYSLSNNHNFKNGTPTFAQLARQLLQEHRPEISMRVIATHCDIPDSTFQHALSDRKNPKTGFVYGVSRVTAIKLARFLELPDDTFDKCSNISDVPPHLHRNNQKTAIAITKAKSSNNNKKKKKKRGFGSAENAQESTSVTSESNKHMNGSKHPIPIPVQNSKSDYPNRWEIKRQVRERIKITGPMSDMYICQTLLEDEGFVVKRNGSHINSETLLDGDNDFFTCTAERITEG